MQQSPELVLPSLKGKKVLITGGLGFIGSNLAHACLKLGAEVSIYDCLDPNSGGNIYNIHDIKKSVKLIFSDILNFDEVSRHVGDKDVLFNCCASTSHPFSMREPWVDLDINGRGVINQLEAVRRFNRDIKFVHLGTTTQIGKMQYKPIDELHPEFPTDIYSANKSASEKYVLIYAKAYNIAATVLRLPNVFGPCASIHSSDFNFINYFIGLALQGKDITVYGDGKQLRNVIYVDDCVSALIIASETSKTNSEVFFVSGDGHFSVLEIASLIVKKIGSGNVKCVPWPQERKVTEIGDAIINSGKIKRVLKWCPAYNFENGLIKTKKYYDKCLKHYLR